MNGGLSMVEMKSGYKMTEVGVIPEDWEVKTLGKLACINGRIGFRGYTVKDLVRKGEGAIAIGGKHISKNFLDLSDAEYISWKKYYESPEIMVKQGDIVLAQRGTLGKSALIKSDIGPATINPSLVLINKIKCNNLYLIYNMQSSSVTDYILQINSQTSIPMISQKQIEGIKIAIAKLDCEQAAIAAALSDVDSLISALTKKIEKKKAIKQGLMQQLLTGKKRLPGYKGLALVKNEKMEYPGDWDVVKLGDLCRIITKQTGFDYSATIKPSLRTSRGLGVLPFIQNKDFEGYKINFNTDFYIPKDVAMHFPQILLDEPSLLVSISGRIGNVGYYLSSKLAFIGGAICVAKFWKKEYIPWVMLYLQSSKGQNEIFMNEKAGAQHNITVEAIRNFRIPMPSISEQTAIANILSDCDSEIAALEEKRDKYKEIKQGMMQQLLTGKIRLIK